MIDKPRGTRDFLPEQMEKRKRLEQRMRAVFECYGYEEVATPTIEHLDLFTLKSGEGIIEETYSFEDKAGRKLALRPELTAPVMRMYVASLQMEAKPLKLYYFGNCFRYDRPQKGRYREFWQFGCELIGTERPEGIAELIALAYEVLKESGLRHLILRIGNLDILRRFLDGIGARDAEIMRLIDKKDFDELRNRMAEKDFDEFMKFISIKNLDDIPYEEARDMKEMLSFLEELSVPYNIDLSIARGLDYYIGTVFEIDAPKLGAEKQLCGGGTYNLVPLLGGKKIPTSGFAIGFDRALVALEAEGYAFEESAKPVYVAPMQDMVSEALRVAKTLRKNGIKTDIDLMGRNMKKSLDYADRRGMNTVVIVAPDEWQKGNVVVKDMQKGEQHEVARGDLPSFLKKFHS
ncbi:MAG TPA: histidine--tRNA ligase [Thermoplasmatales archaeon]|nr:MAG: histidine--tRNA ligase [Thermoplasmata archaeon]RLF31745.1 MAG: histidine--tRNA ligase [Thermoplasmata archaeon]HDN50380.1 histidine--tRNA ligase [Thermoplasmatales archaeon]